VSEEAIIAEKEAGEETKRFASSKAYKKEQALTKT
jgi:hypothetical protein